MSELPAGKAGGGVTRKTLIHAGVVVALLAGGVVGVQALERAMNAVFDKPPAPLAKSLTEVGRRLGDPVRYEAVGSDEILPHEIVEALGTEDYLVREYRDKSKKEGDPGAFVNLNLNYYATGSSTPHVPEICWAGTGRQEAEGSRGTFDVPHVKRKDGSEMTLRVRMISFTPDPRDVAQLPAPGGPAVYTNVAYVFHVNGDYVPNTQEVTSHFWKASNRYAYHAKIEVTPMIRTAGMPGSRPLVCTREEAERVVADFLREVMADVEGCLPNPAILTSGSPTASGTSTR